MRKGGKNDILQMQKNMQKKPTNHIYKERVLIFFMPRPRIYLDRKTYRREYNARLDVKAKNKIHNQKWKSKPEVQLRLRKYIREYMRTYWDTRPEKYALQKLKIAQLNRERNLRKKTSSES